ncbi:MAG: peptide chain release factor N(5)-glutamine methyltransferase [Rhodoluna sp.]
MLISEALKSATEKLVSAGVTSPSVDAELLGCFILGVQRSELTMLLIGDETFPEDKIGKFEAALSRRVKREPLQHITGLAPFRHLELYVGPGVFTPRPETEQLVELAIEKIKENTNPVVVDLCSGSGAIAISLATELVAAEVYSVELSEQAFGFLERNYQKYGLDSKSARNEDLADAFDELEAKVDLVISNPPYIPDSAVPVDLEVQLHEPSLALYGGKDGLDVIRKISSRALYLLKPSGLLLLEHADSQARAIGELLLSQGWLEVTSSQDLAGKDRMISALKP